MTALNLGTGRESKPEWERKSKEKTKQKKPSKYIIFPCNADMEIKIKDIKMPLGKKSYENFSQGYIMICMA